MLSKLSLQHTSVPQFLGTPTKRGSTLVPKSALNTQEQFNAFRAGRYQVGVETRLQQLAASDMPFRPYSDDESAHAR
jgi:hypothetical protein